MVQKSIRLLNPEHLFLYRKWYTQSEKTDINAPIMLKYLSAITRTE